MTNLRDDGAEGPPAFPMPDGDLLAFLDRRGIRRVQDPDEWREFSALVLDYFAGARDLVVVEIGTQSGGTFFSFYNLFHRALGVLASIDLRLYSRIDMAYPREHYAEEYRCFDRLVENLRDGRLAVIVGDSHSPSTRDALVAALAGRPIDLCFIDGDHSYEGVKADYSMYRDMVRPGGLICFHDIATVETPGGPLPVRVTQFWDELRARGRCREIVRARDKGIGIIEL